MLNKYIQELNRNRRIKGKKAHLNFATKTKLKVFLKRKRTRVREAMGDVYVSKYTE